MANAALRAPLIALLARLEAAIPDGPRLGIDLGCGSGTDATELLRRGWHVVAIDATPEAIQVLLERPNLAGRERFETIVGRLEETTWPTADLVTASLVPPFILRAGSRVSGSASCARCTLKPGSLFTGPFLATRRRGATADAFAP